MTSSPKSERYRGFRLTVTGTPLTGYRGEWHDSLGVASGMTDIKTKWADARLAAERMIDAICLAEVDRTATLLHPGAKGLR